MTATDIDVNDFRVMITIIDACAERGAIKGNEIFVVGQLREKLARAVQASEAAAAAAQQPVDVSE